MGSKKLNIGDFGGEVAALHKKLKKHGFNVSAEEIKRKFFGPTTREAVGEFQKIHRIEPSHEVCDKTASLLAANPLKPADESTSAAEKIAIARVNKTAATDNAVIPNEKELKSEISSIKSAEDDAGIKLENPLHVKEFEPGADSTPSARNKSRHSFASKRFGVGEFDSSDPSIVFPLKLFNQDQVVADLQSGLKFLGFDIPSRESEIQRFGRVTRKSVLGFQKKHGLTETGQVDQETASQLNKVLKAAGYFSKKVKSLGSHKCLRCKLRDTEQLDNSTKGFVQQRLNERLKEIVINQFQQPSEVLQAAINKLELNYQSLADQSLDSIMLDYIAPTLLEYSDLEKEVEQQAKHGFAQSTEKISQLLYLDQPIKLHPFFAKEVRQVKNDAIAKIVQLKENEKVILDEIDLTLVDKNTIDEFVKDGRLRTEVRDDLISVAEFAKLTDDDYDAVTALRDEGIKHPEELVVKDTKDWVAFLDRHSIEPPEKLDRKDFAKIIDLNIQITFRTSYTMERFSRCSEEVLKKIDDLGPLFARNSSIFVDTKVNRELDLSDISKDKRPHIQANLQALNKFANRYARLGVCEVLNDATLSSDEKKSRIIKRQTALGTFYNKNPDFDLAWANFRSIDSDMARAFKPSWGGIDDEDVQPVRNLLTALQRTYLLTTTYDEMDALLGAGLDSADAVRRLPESELLQTTGLGKNVISRIRARAIDASVRAAHFVSLITESITNERAAPATINNKLKANHPDLKIINLLKEIDGYADFFGNQNYCRCLHCRSIFSPGAYFVDLMRFIEKHISKAHFINPGKSSHALYLKNRRSDLWYLQLSCKNTDTLIPYLTIVNEVLAKYLKQVFDTTDIFKALTSTQRSFKQPFNLPFAELRLYLRHFGVKLEHIYALFDGSGKDHTRAILGLSPQEFVTITTPDPDGVKIRYGNPANGAQLNVQDLIKKMNITREDLGRLLASNYVRIDLLTDFEIKSERNDLVGYTETLKISLDTGKLVSTQFEAIVRLLLDRLHRFVRLWRALSWTPEDIDLLIGGVKLGNGLDVKVMPANTGKKHKVITTVIDGKLVRIADKSRGMSSNKEKEHQLVGSRLNADLLSIIADMQRLQDDLSLSFQEAYALVFDLPLIGSSPDKSGLFQRLFGDTSTLSIKHPALGNSDDDPFVSPDFGVLQGGLRLDEAELLGLLTAKLSTVVVALGVVSHEEISQLYRYARFSRALGWRSSELLIVEQILNLDLAQVQNEVPNRLLAIKAVQAFAEVLDRTPFSLAELGWLLLSEAKTPPEIIDTAKLLADIRLDLKTANPLLFRPEDLLPLYGLDLDGARRLLFRFSQDTAPEQRTAPWLKTTDKEETTYVLSVEIGAEPDQQMLREAINDANLVMATDNTPEADAKKETIIYEMAIAIAERLQTHHPVTLFFSSLIKRLDITADFFSQLSFFMLANPASQELLEHIFLWSHDETVPESEELVGLVNELQQHIYVFKTKLSFPEESLAFIAQNSEIFSLDSPIVWSWEGLRRFSLYHKFSGKTPEPRAALHRLLNHWTNETFSAEAKEDMALILGVSPFDLGPILERIVMPRNPFDALVRVSNAASLVSTLGLDGVSMAQLTATSYEGLTAAKNLIFGAIRAKYDDAEWPKIIELFDDELNMLKRDALVDQVLSRESQLKFSDTREIYQFFLLDVNMDGCARISRVKEAILACQLYIHRCLMSLEQSESGDVAVRIEQEAKDQWPWRKNYRVWEANRKVFLYPENYLEPDLRDNKSHIFKQAEAELMQRPLTPQGLEVIYKSYLREFSELTGIIIVSAYYDKSKETYFLFGRTRRKPYQYYYRKFIRLARWTNWEPIDLTIEAERINAVKHKGQLHLFWLSPVKSEESDRMVGEVVSEEKNYKTNGSPLIVNHSTLDELGVWSSVQSYIFYMFSGVKKDHIRYRYGPWSDRVFPESSQKISLSHILHSVPPGPDAFNLPDDKDHRSPEEIRGYLDLLRNKINNSEGSSVEQYEVKELNFHSTDIDKYGSSGLHTNNFKYHQNRRLYASVAQAFESEAAAQVNLDYVNFYITQNIVASFPNIDEYDLMIVNNQVRDNIFQFKDQSILIRSTGRGGWRQEITSAVELGPAYANTKRLSYRLSTSVGGELAEKLFNQGLDKFLSLETQAIHEKTLEQQGLEFQWVGELAPPRASGTHLDFKGAYGDYFREIFFHLPFLIGHYLNAKQKFADADYWYRKIFDPTAQPAAGKKPSKRDKWRFIEFHNVETPKLRTILTDEAAIDVYESDPFNPHAIARLRISAYQKAIVMRYIDNLLDWGDYLFAQDTFESINEATMLYVMASDILGDKPVEVGECDTANESFLSYDQIVIQDAARSDFLFELENIIYVNFFLFPTLFDSIDVSKDSNKVFPMTEISGNLINTITNSSGFATLRANKNKSFVRASVISDSLVRSTTVHANTNLTTENIVFELANNDSPFEPRNDLVMRTDPPRPCPPAGIDDYHVAAVDPQTIPGRQDHLAFCVPPNETLLGYWDRVEDRLFKIRHCMNIEGVRRQLPLFQPPIDPALLVRLKAAGLSLEDILGLLGKLNADMPSYRFKTLLEKARQFTAAAQQLGNQIQAALERKDTEELVLLQATQQDEINEAIHQVKLDNKREAKETHLSLQNAGKTVKNRECHYQSLLDNTKDKALAISQEEIDQLDHLVEGQGLQQKSMQSDKAASMHHIMPTWNTDASAGGLVTPPFYMGHAIASVNFGSSNLAAKETKKGQEFRKEAQRHDFEASQAGLRAGYERRKSEWVHQKQQASMEYEQLQKQCLAAEIREEIADKDLIQHEKQTEHARELYDFYKDKFTNLGLYTYLSTSLSRLYREAYNLAYDMALKAQQAYQFETDDNSFLLKNDNWDNSKAGLLAGDRLLLQLQQMEKNYLERYRRQYEVTLPCSLAQINPQAILQLQQSGNCEFELPEYWFDLYYPGQYKRRIKSIRITIPCVLGPYANLGAKLTLTGSRIRLEPRLDPQSLVFAPAQRNTSIATSTANADPGIFEFNFNGEQYLPFEGAGAISSWRLELPREMRVFDYSTISDVIVHVGFTAKDDGLYKEMVEGNLRQTFRDIAQSNQLIRLISFKHEFASEFHRLTHPQEGQSAATTIRLSKKHFPFFLRDERLTLGTSRVLLEADHNQQFISEDLPNLNQNLSMRINDIEVSGWAFQSELNFPTSSPFNLNTLQVTDEGNDLVITIEGHDISDLSNLWLQLSYGFDD